MTPGGFFLYAAVLIATPWCLGWFGFPVRCVVIGGAALVALALWLRAVWPGRRQADHRRLSRARPAVCLGVAVAAGAWVALLSYSAQVSIIPSLLIYAGLVLMVFVPIIVTEWICPRQVDRRGWRIRYGALCVALVGSMLAAQPGRRFHGGETSEVVRRAAEGVSSAEESVSRVNGLIDYASAPFTDTAADTLMRGQAHCGGIANSLDKVLKAIGLESRIVHVEDGRRIHTLVEYFDPHLRQWLLADAQHNVIGQDGETISGWDAVHGPGGPSVPEAWRGYTRLYVYRRFGGYHRVTGKNRHVYYP